METQFQKTLALREITSLKEIVAEKYGTDTSLMGHVEMLESIVERRPVVTEKGE